MISLLIGGGIWKHILFLLTPPRRRPAPPSSVATKARLRYWCRLGGKGVGDSLRHSQRRLHRQVVVETCTFLHGGEVLARAPEENAQCNMSS